MSGGVCVESALLSYLQKKSVAAAKKDETCWITFEDSVAVCVCVSVFCTYLFCVATTGEIRRWKEFFLVE